MSTDDVILAIDQGTGSTKALLVDHQGTVVGKGSCTLGQQTPRPGWVEQSVEDIWASVGQAVSAALSGHDPARVAAVGLSTQRESLVLWERATGNPLTPLISWQDHRTAQACQDLQAAGHGETVKRISGLPLDPMFSATKAQWLLDRYDPDRARSGRGELCLGTVDSFLLWRFGAQHMIEIGNAARTQLFNIATRTWDPDLLDLFDVPEQVLPIVVPSTGPFATAAHLLDVPSAPPITAVMGDSHAALFAHAAWQPGAVKVTYGTGSSVMGIADPAVRVGDGLCLTIAWEDGEPTYAVEGNIRASGATLLWLARLFDTTPERLAAAAADARSDGVFVVPAFNGLGAPWWDRNATGLIVGLTLGTQLPNLARAVLESVVLQVEDVVAAVDDTVQPVEVLLADGGGSTNPVLMQLQADVSGRRVQQALAGELSSLGVAHLAGLAIGYWTQHELADLHRARRTFEATSDPADRAAFHEAWGEALSRARMRAGTTNV